MLFPSSSSRFLLTRSSGEILNGKPESASIDSKQLCLILMEKNRSGQTPYGFYIRYNRVAPYGYNMPCMFFACRKISPFHHCSFVVLFSI